MKSSVDKGLIDLGVQTIYKSNGFQSFHTFKTFQSLSISERSNRSVVVQFDFNAASM